MKRLNILRALLLTCTCLGVSTVLEKSVLFAQVETACPDIQRRLPPRGLDIPGDLAKAWDVRLEEYQSDLASLDEKDTADVRMLLKAVEYAIRFNEFYTKKDFAKADRLLNLAESRIQDLRAGNSDWKDMQGRQVRGFISEVDGSVQPVGLVFPEQLKGSSASKLVPLYVWLHGRGDKKTDLHFICERLDRDGQITPDGAIVLHPFGRQCVGYKSAGETDVMEAIDFVCSQYPIDRDRIVLMGFSMGGAGVWHLAAHYGERFVAASPGAGFAETAEYQKLTPETYPPKYEQTLWSIYDVPGYTRNLFNIPVVAYSGENDKQIQAARVMERAYRKEGRQLPHLIGPGMGHKYHPDTLQQILAEMKRAEVKGRTAVPKEINIQAKHLRYGQRNGIVIDGQFEPYSDTRVLAKRTGEQLRIETKNVSRLTLNREQLATADVEIGEQRFQLPSGMSSFVKSKAGWSETKFELLRKRPKLSGPIDDAFIDPFLVVLPSGTPQDAQIGRWVNCELTNFKNRWSALFRGEPRVKFDKDVTADDMQKYHLVLWGDPQSNSLIKRFCANSQSPMKWDGKELQLGGWTVNAKRYVPLVIFPNFMSLEQGSTQDSQVKYVVVNSGPTFRQAHDRTNSLQNPHLPDWAIVGVELPPNDETPGRIAAAGFFDQSWK